MTSVVGSCCFPLRSQSDKSSKVVGTSGMQRRLWGFFPEQEKTRCTSRYGCATSLAFYELEYTNYVGNIIPHAITSLM